MKRLKLFFKSLISNQACIEGGRFHPWWIAIPTAIVSVLLAVLPIMINLINTNGRDFVKAATYNYDSHLITYSKALETETSYNLEFKKDGETKKIYLDFGKELGGNGEKLYTHKNAEDKLDFIVYGYNTDIAKSFDSFISVLNKNVNDPITGSERTEEEKYVSYLVLGKYKVVFGIYANGATTVKTALTGDYINVKEGFKFADFATVKDGEGNVIPVTTTDPVLYRKLNDEIFKNWKSFFDKVYLNTKTRTATIETLIILGVNVVTVFVFGLVIFIRTRGKQNPYRIYTFWESQKIAYWGSFSPAILALILGFIMGNSTFSLFFFAGFFGIRIFWLSFKSLSAQYSE